MADNSERFHLEKVLFNRDKEILELRQNLKDANNKIEALEKQFLQNKQLPVDEGTEINLHTIPWSLVEVDENQITIVDNKGSRVLPEGISFSKQDNGLIANLRMIVAAPELYEGLVSAREQLKVFVDVYMKTPYEDDLIDKAIKKAEGR